MANLETHTLADLMKDYTPLPRPKNSPPLNLSQIIGIEPCIAEILSELKPSRRNNKWFRQYFAAKKKLSKLVGWQADNYNLRTSQVYDVVMDYVISKLDGKGEDYVKI